jgi:low temperature requirement protein LtrA
VTSDAADAPLRVTTLELFFDLARYPLSAAALAVQLGSPLVVHPGAPFTLNPFHLSERHSSLLIVALGESVAAIGIATASHPGGVSARLVTSSVLGLALAAALWWVLFGGDDEERAQAALTTASSERRTALALQALFYGNAPVLLGLVAMAAGVQEAIEHPAAAQPATAALLAAGAALFLAGDAVVRRLLWRGRVRFRAAGAVVALATTAAGATAGLQAQVALLAVVLVAMLLAERRWTAPAEATDATDATEPATAAEAAAYDPAHDNTAGESR